LQLGLTLAFKESINWLVGGINYVAGVTGPAIGKAFTKSIDFLQKAWDFIFSGSTFEMVVDGFVGVASQFSAAMLDGINTVIQVFSAGMQAAISSIQTSSAMNEFVANVNAIADGVMSKYGDGYNYVDSYNKYLNAAKDTKSDSFDEIMKRTKGPISQDYIDKVRGSGQELTGRSGEEFKQFAANLFPQGGNGKFQKSNVFNTDDDKAKFADVIARAIATAKEMGGKAGEGEKAPKILSDLNTKGGRYVIADNLAKVGGGGGYLNVGMSLSERTAVEQLKAQQQSEKTLQAIKKNTESKPQPVTLAR